MAIRVLFIGLNLFQDGITRLLDEQKNLELIGAVSSWKVAKNQIVSDQPDVLIMDHQNPELREAELGPLLESIQKPIKIIYLTLSDNRIIIHDRKQIINADLPDLVNALTNITGEEQA